MIRVKKVDEIIPPIMVQPRGDHKPVPEAVSGNNPRIVVVVVRIMGVNLVSVAIFKAFNNVIPLRLS